ARSLKEAVSSEGRIWNGQSTREAIEFERLRRRLRLAEKRARDSREMDPVLRRKEPVPLSAWTGMRTVYAIYHLASFSGTEDANLRKELQGAIHQLSLRPDFDRILGQLFIELGLTGDNTSTALASDKEGIRRWTIELLKNHEGKMLSKTVR